jgi:hypothetical protein
MWEHRCKLLADYEEILQFTKVDYAIRHLFAKKDLFLNVDKGLFALPLAQILAKTTSTKQGHLLVCKPPKSDGKKAQTPLCLKTSSIPLIDMPCKRKPRNVENKEKAQRKKDEKRKTEEPRQCKRNNKT